MKDRWVKDGEVFDAESRSDLVVNNPVQHSRKNAPEKAEGLSPDTMTMNGRGNSSDAPDLVAKHSLMLWFRYCQSSTVFLTALARTHPKKHMHWVPSPKPYLRHNPSFAKPQGQMLERD